MVNDRVTLLKLPVKGKAWAFYAFLKGALEASESNAAPLKTGHQGYSQEIN